MTKLRATFFVLNILLCLLFDNSGAIASSSKISSNPNFEIRFVISEPCSLIRFVDTISDRDHTTSWLKDWYFQQRTGSDADGDRVFLANYKKGMDKISEHYLFKDETGRAMNLNQKIACLAADCSTLQQLLLRIKKTVRSDDFPLLNETFQHFEPLHKKLVWEPRLTRLQAQLEEFRREADKTRMPEKLVAVQHFMGTTWLARTPFTVVLVPLPESKIHHTHGESIGKTQIVELLTFHEFKDEADVVFHEGCHALWGRKRDIASLKSAFINVGGREAYAELNEGLATALGQGWFNDTAFGAAPTTSWYSDTVINTYSHQLFPLVSEYMKAERIIDDDFAQRAAEAFAQSFPDADRETRLTKSLRVYSEKYANSSELASKIRSALPWLQSLSLISSVPSKFGANDSDRSIVLLSSIRTEPLKKAGLSNVQLAALKSNAGKPLSLKLKNKDVVFIVADSEKQDETLLNMLKEQRWPANYPGRQ